MTQTQTNIACFLSYVKFRKTKFFFKKREMTWKQKGVYYRGRRNKGEKGGRKLLGGRSKYVICMFEYAQIEPITLHIEYATPQNGSLHIYSQSLACLRGSEFLAGIQWKSLTKMYHCKAHFTLNFNLLWIILNAIVKMMSLNLTMDLLLLQNLASQHPAGQNRLFTALGILGSTNKFTLFDE